MYTNHASKSGLQVVLVSIVRCRDLGLKSVPKCCGFASRLVVFHSPSRCGMTFGSCCSIQTNSTDPFKKLLFGKLLKPPDEHHRSFKKRLFVASDMENPVGGLDKALSSGDRIYCAEQTVSESCASLSPQTSANLLKPLQTRPEATWTTCWWLG